MTQITTYPMIDDFDTTLAQARDWSVWTVYLNDAVGITIPASTTTYLVVNPWKSTMQVAEINAVNNTLKTATVNNITVDKGAWVAYTQQSHPVGSVVRISTNYAFWKDIVDAVNTKVNTNDDDIAQGKFANATARDAYFTAPVNGNSAYLIAEGKRTDYVAWAWADRASWTNPNASDTVAGKVEISTQAEFDAWTATGWTWASIVATNDQIRKQINTATAKTTPVNADSIGIADSAASGVIKKTTLTQLKAASDMQATTTTSWFVEMATDAEVTAGTDETRYVNPKQLGLKNKTFITNITRAIDAASWSVVIAHWLPVPPKYITAEAINAWWNKASSKWSSDFTTHRCNTDEYNWNWSSYTHTITQQNALIYIKDSNSSWTNFFRTQSCTVTADATNITFVRTYTDSWSTLTSTIMINILAVV